MSAFWVPPTLRGYRRAWLGADALAALTLVAVALPSQMATARLAGLPAVVALYAFLSGSLLYAALGTKPHLSVGADSTIAPVLATAATAVAAAGSAGYAATMAFICLLYTSTSFPGPTRACTAMAVRSSSCSCRIATSTPPPPPPAGSAGPWPTWRYPTTPGPRRPTW